MKKLNIDCWFAGWMLTENIKII